MLLDVLAKAGLASPTLRRLIPFLLAVVMMALAGGSVFAEGSIVEGKITNGTAGAASPVGQEATLQSISKEGVLTAAQSVKTDAQGGFRFAGVESSNTLSYTVSTTYQGATYYSDALTVGAQTQRPVELVVYESTDSRAGLSVQLAHGVLQTNPDSKNIWVVEVLVLSNDSDRTYAGDSKNMINDATPTLIFSLPPGATHFQPMQGIDPDTVIELPNGFAATDPVQPGAQTIAYSYLLPPSGNTTTFARTMDYPTARFVTLVPESVGPVDSGSLSKGQPAEIGDDRYQTFVGQNLSPGTTITVRFGGRTFPWLPFDDRTSAGMAGALVLLLGAGVFFWRRRTATQLDEPDGDDLEVGHDEREMLVTELAELEDSFETGDIEEHEYEKARAARERRLAELDEIAGE